MTERWYVVEAYEGEDEAAYLRLAAAFCQTTVRVWRPIDVTRATVRGSRAGAPIRRERRRARFGRFMFVHCEMTDSLFHAVSSATNVRRLLTYSGSHEPAAVPDSLVEFWRADIPARARELPQGLGRGAVVRIEAGPFIGLQGPVIAIDDKGIAAVEIQIMGRPTPIPFEVGHVSVVVAQAKPPISRASLKAAAKPAPSAKLARNQRHVAA